MWSYEQRTPGSDLVERAVNDLLLGPDWAVNIEVCDYVSRKGDVGAKQVCKALRGKLQGSDPKLLLLALTLAETMMQNGNPQTYEFVGSKYVLAEMERYAQKSKADLAVREKILSLVQAWAEAFRQVRDPRFQAFAGAYNRLRQARLNFPPLVPDVVPTLVMTRLPATNRGRLDLRAQQHTEELDPEMLEAIRISAALDEQERRASVDLQRRPPPQQQQQQQRHDDDDVPVAYPAPGYHVGGARGPGPPPPPPLPLDPRQLKEDLQVAASTIETFGEVLGGIPEAEAAQALGEEFVEEMLATVKELGPKLIRLAEDPRQDEEVLMTSLAVNDSLQTVLAKYDAMVARHAPRAQRGADGGGNLIDGLDGPNVDTSTAPASSGRTAGEEMSKAEGKLPIGVAPPPTITSPMTIKWQGVAQKALNVTAVASPASTGPGSVAAPLISPPGPSSPTHRSTPLTAPALLAPPPGSIQRARSTRSPSSDIPGSTSSGPATTDLASLLGDTGPPSTSGISPTEQQRKATTLPGTGRRGQDDVFDLDLLNDPVHQQSAIPPPSTSPRPAPLHQGQQQHHYGNGGSLI